MRLGSDGSLIVVDASGLHAGAAADDRAAAFRRLLDAAVDDAYRRAAVILANRIEAEDAVHDAAERAWRSWASLRDNRQFDAWFARILLNVCRDRLRRRRRVAVVEVRGEPPEAEDVASTAAFRRVDDRARMLDALAGLSADERIAIALRYESDLSVPEIARLIGAPEGTIKARLHRALGRLRLRLDEEHGE